MMANPLSDQLEGFPSSKSSRRFSDADNLDQIKALRKFQQEFNTKTDDSVDGSWSDCRRLINQQQISEKEGKRKQEESK